MALSLFRRSFSPLLQAGLVFTGALVFMLGGFALGAAGVYRLETLFPWSIATAFLLLFAILNSLMCLKASNTLKYWGSSVYSYLALAVANGLAAWLFSGIPLGEAESYRWIYIVVTIGFLVFLSMVNFMKKIVEFAEREEWNQPRQRRK